MKVARVNWKQRYEVMMKECRRLNTLAGQTDGAAIAMKASLQARCGDLQAENTLLRKLAMKQLLIALRRGVR